MTHNELKRIGNILVNNHVLTNNQLALALDRQAACGKPLGLIVEQLFNIPPKQIERAWQEQYASFGTRCDLSAQSVDEEVLSTLTRRQAWQMQLMPLHREDGTLVLATTFDNLPRASRFAWRKLNQPIHLVIVEEDQLHDHLNHYYPWAGASAISSLFQNQQRKCA